MNPNGKMLPSLAAGGAVNIQPEFPIVLVECVPAYQVRVEGDACE